MRAGWRWRWLEWPAIQALGSRWAMLSAVTLLYWLGNQAIRPFLPLRLQQLGASDLMIGAAVAGSSAAGLLLAAPSGFLLNRVPQRAVLIAALVGVAVSTASFVVTTSVAVLAAEMVVNGACAMWVWLVLQSMITGAGPGAAPEVGDRASPVEARDQQLALFSMAWGVGLAAGPSLGAWLYDVAKFPALCVMVTLLVIAGVGVAAAAPRVGAATAEVAESEARLGGALRSSLANPVLISVLLASFVNLYAHSIRISFYPVYLERAGVAVTAIGTLLSLIGICSLAVRAVLTAALRRFGATHVLLWSTCMPIVGIALTPVSTEFVVLATGALLMGVGLGASPPVTVNLIASSSPPGQRGVAVGLRMVANRSAQVLQPLLFGGVASIVGLAAAFPASGVLLGGLTVWMAARLRKQAGGLRTP